MTVRTAEVRVLHDLPATPPPRVAQTASPFSGTWTDTLEILRREVAQVGGREVVLVVDARSGSLRRDGGLKAEARVLSDYVEVFLPATDRGPMRFACGRFTGDQWGSLAGWQANVRAIALGMEALRRVKRYGIADDDQQYSGFGALPPGDPIALGSAMTMDEAARVVADASGHHPWDAFLPQDGATSPWLADAYRAAVKAHHPDVGGDPEEFRRITEARDLLLTG